VCDSSVFAGTNGDGVWRRPLLEITGTTSRLQEQHNAFNVRVAMDAGGGMMWFYDLSGDKYTVSVFDVRGKRVVQEGIKGPGKVALSFACGTGIYIIRIKDAEGVAIRKLMKGF
jgi:hypothetical protein